MTDAQQTGLITSVLGRHYQLETPAGQRLIAHSRGKKKEAVVGDKVLWSASHDEAVIESITPRHNLFYRQDETRTKAFAANLDQILMVIAAEPEFSERQLSRALIAAAGQSIEIKVILNKADLHEPFARAWHKLQTYIQMGYTIIPAQFKHAQSTQTLELLAPVLKDKATLLLGPSGAGKSTLINALIPEAAVLTGELSTALKTGKHTTTATQWHWLTSQPAIQSGAIIDSPGFQEFGMHHIQPEELADLMPDIKAHLGQCRFYNCTHMHEPGCGVIQAVQEAHISPVRYAIYQEIMSDLLNSTKY